jgi:nucleoside-diphosphate-sugar epimerase
MRVFMTGATGFIGSIVVEELTAAGHAVTGPARSDDAAAKLAGWGAAVVRGDVVQPENLADAAGASDGVIHCAFDSSLGAKVESSDSPTLAAASRRSVPPHVAREVGSQPPQRAFTARTAAFGGANFGRPSWASLLGSFWA